jgi:hypothetical protein
MKKFTSAFLLLSQSFQANLGEVRGWAPSVAVIQPNLELKTRPKQLLGSLPLVIALSRLVQNL